MVVVQISCREGGKRFVVEAVRRGCSVLDDIALVELQVNLTCDILLRFLREGDHAAHKRREPLSFVDDLSHLGGELLLELHEVAVEAELLELLMCRAEDCAARSLIDAAGLHADDTVLDDIDNADAVLTAEHVELTDDLRDLHGLAVQCLRDALLECERHAGLLVRCLLRCDG